MRSQNVSVAAAKRTSVTSLSERRSSLLWKGSLFKKKRGKQPPLPGESRRESVTSKGLGAYGPVGETPPDGLGQKWSLSENYRSPCQSILPLTPASWKDESLADDGCNFGGHYEMPDVKPSVSVREGILLSPSASSVAHSSRCMEEDTFDDEYQYTDIERNDTVTGAPQLYLDTSIITIASANGEESVTNFSCRSQTSCGSPENCFEDSEDVKNASGGRPKQDMNSRNTGNTGCPSCGSRNGSIGNTTDDKVHDEDHGNGSKECAFDRVKKPLPVMPCDGEKYYELPGSNMSAASGAGNDIPQQKPGVIISKPAAGDDSKSYDVATLRSNKNEQYDKLNDGISSGEIEESLVYVNHDSGRKNLPLRI